RNTIKSIRRGVDLRLPENGAGHLEFDTNDAFPWKVGVAPDRRPPVRALLARFLGLVVDAGHHARLPRAEHQRAQGVLVLVDDALLRTADEVAAVRGLDPPAMRIHEQV